MGYSLIYGELSQSNIWMCQVFHHQHATHPICMSKPLLMNRYNCTLFNACENLEMGSLAAKESESEMDLTRDQNNEKDRTELENRNVI